MRIRATWAAALAVLIAAGCGGPKGPTTYPAGGKAVYADGAALTGGTVQFQAQADPSVSAVGEIRPDGKFTLYTLADGEKYAGAVEGAHRVTVIPAQGADQTSRPGAPPLPVTLPDLVTVKAPGPNDFTLTVPRPH